MNINHVMILVTWTIVVLFVTGGFVVAFTFGDCMDASACDASKTEAARIILGIGFVTYWIVFVGLVRRWSR